MFIVVYYITFYNAILFLRFQMISKLPIKARPFENMPGYGIDELN